MPNRFSDHLRQNVYGLVAIFIALSGTAYATHPGGANTISSADIIDEEIRTWDIRDNHVRTSDLQNGAVNRFKLGKGSVVSEKVNNGAISELKLAPDAVTASKLAPGAVTGAKVEDNSLTGDDIGFNALGTAAINENDLFNDDSLDAADISNLSTLGTAEINESSLNAVEGPSNMQMLFGREQLSGGESGPASVIFASGRANVNAEKNGSNDRSLTFLNSPFAGVTLTFVREVVNGSTITLTSGTLAQGGTDSTAAFATPIQVRWQAWAAGDFSATGRVITLKR